MNFFIIARKLYINRNIYLIFYQFILHISNYYYYLLFINYLIICV